MARMTVVVNSILPCQEAFLVDAPTPNTSPHRWIQVKSVHAEGLPSSVVGLFSEPRNGDVIVVSKCGVAVLVGRDEVLHVNCSPLRRDPDLNLVAAVY